MFQLIVNVAAERDGCARLRILDGSTTVFEDWASASVDPSVARRMKNTRADPLRPGGHPPMGRYELTARDSAPQGTQGEYGNTLLLFEPVGGQALDAESYGRLGLLVYSGRMAPDAKLRRTQGGLRLSTTAMGILLDRIDDRTPVELRIEPMEPPPWWAFWRTRLPPAPPLSDRPPQFDAPPLDEPTLMAELMKLSRRRYRSVERDDRDDEWERRRDRDYDRDSRSSSSDPPEFRGKGGEGGGAGASGGWSDASSTPGRGPGVDAAGRIVTAAGVAAIATAAAMASREQSTEERTAPPSGESASADIKVDGSGADDGGSISASSGSDSSWSSSGTSY